MGRESGSWDCRLDSGITLKSSGDQNSDGGHLRLHERGVSLE